MKGLQSIAKHTKNGIKIKSSADMAKEIVRLAKQGLGDKYPDFLSKNKLGASLEPYLVDILVICLAQNLNLPFKKQLQKVSAYAIEGVSGDLFTEVLANFTPDLSSSLQSIAGLVLALNDDDDDDDDD